MPNLYPDTTPRAGDDDTALLGKQLQLLAAGITTTPGTGTTRTPAFTAATSSGTVTAGAKSVTFIFSTDFAGTILGTTIDLSTMGSITFTAPSGDTLSAIAYTRSAGTIYIQTIV